jgi:hypothetical protein
MSGTLGILNVGAGDTKLSFDPKNPVECIRAARIVKDMVRRGYALLVDAGDGRYQRVREFDDSKYEYIIADFDPVTADEHDRGEHGKDKFSEAAAGTAAEDNAKPQKRKPGRPRFKRVSAAKTRGVAVARTSGG